MTPITDDLLKRVTAHAAIHQDAEFFKEAKRESPEQHQQLADDLLAAVVALERLPVTADGAKVLPGMKAWIVVPAGVKEIEYVAVCADPPSERNSFRQHHIRFVEGGLGAECAQWSTENVYYHRANAEAAARKEQSNDA